jgi:hypothetical protein
MSRWGNSAWKMMLSQIAAPAIWARLNSAWMNGISPLNSRLSLEPTSAISAAAGGRYRSATDSSIGKLRLNATLDIVVGTGIRSTAAIAAIQISTCHAGISVYGGESNDGSCTREMAIHAMIGIATQSS